MMRGHPGQRFRRPPKVTPSDGPSAIITQADHEAADRFFESTGLTDGMAWIEIISGAEDVYFVLNVGPEWRGSVPDLPEHFEGRRVFSEPGRIELA